MAFVMWKYVPSVSTFFICFYLDSKKYHYNVVLVSAIQPCKSAIVIHTSPSFPTSLPSLHPIPQVITDHKTQLPVLVNFSPAIHLTPGSVYTLRLLSPSDSLNKSILFIFISIPSLQIGSSV